MVRLSSVGLLMAVVLLFGGASAFAGGLFPSGEGGGDDPVLCCGEAMLPTTPPTTTDFTGVFIFKDCKAIDPGPDAFNRCKGLVVNCAETPAACVSDSNSDDGGKDCLCGINLNLSLLLNINITPSAVLKAH